MVTHQVSNPIHQTTQTITIFSISTTLDRPLLNLSVTQHQKTKCLCSPHFLTMPSQILPISNPNSDLSKASHGDGDPSYGEDKLTSTKPLLPRTLSHGGISSPVAGSHHHHRRSASENSLCLLVVHDGDHDSQAPPQPPRPTAERHWVTRLALKLLGYLKVGYKWVTGLVALGFYAFLLMPGFIQVGYYYFFSKRVLRSIVYGDKPRNKLDLYLPKNFDGPKPVVAFLTGGAWIIGYKAWGSLLGQQLSDRDILVACIDYRNFPQGTISDMIKDSSQGISFVCNNIAHYGGDPKRIYLMGQSAGAHIAACTLVEQAIKESGERESVPWSVTQIKAYFGLSGGYNLLKLTGHFHSRGLHRSTFLNIMEGEQSMQRFSPEVVIQDPNVRSAVARLPPIVLFHGTADYSIPPEASKSFAETLRGVGVTADAILYEGKTHTDLFLQDPMRGGEDEMFEYLLGKIHGDDPESQSKDAVAPLKRRLVPEFMLKLASRVSPF